MAITAGQPISVTDVIDATTGSADAGKLVQTDADGLIDPSFYQAVLALFTAGQNLTAKDYVFLAKGTEVNLSNAQTLTNTTDQMPNTSVFAGSNFVGLSSSQRIKTISVNLTLNGSPTGTILMKIYAQSSGLPTGSPLATSNTVNVATLAGVTAFTFATPFTPSGATQYVFIIETTGTTFPGGSYIRYVVSPSFTGLGRAISTDGGATYTFNGSSFYYLIGNEFVAGSLYKTDPANILPEGPYMGFSVKTITAGNAAPVQIANIIGGFSSLTIGGNVYIDPATPGAVTQTSGLTSGRAIGIAISATQIKIAEMKKRGTGVSFTSNNTIYQDGFLIATISASGATVNVTETFNGATTTVATTGISGGSGAGTTISLTIPVRAGASYSIGSGSAVFYPLING